MKADLANIKMAFIVCMGRSGSTMLQHLFDAHSQIVSPIESKFVLHLRTKYKNIKTWDAVMIDQFIKDLYTDRKFRLFWNVAKEDLRTLFDHYAVHSFADACKVVYLSHPSISEKNDVRLIVDKNPAHSFFTPRLLEVFPDAQIIHLVRDPRAVICSQLRSLHKKSVYVLSQQWNFMNGCIVKDSGDRSLVIHYETLVSEPEKILKMLLECHGIHFEEEMLHQQEKVKERAKTNSFLSLEHHLNVGNPVNTRSVEKWKSELTSSEIEVIGATCKNLAEELGYPLEQVKLSFTQQVLLTYGHLRMIMRRAIVGRLFKLPFWVRKPIYNTVSFFFDRRYK